MKQRVVAALLTVLVFAAGYGARVWTDSNRPLPAPPASLGAEFKPSTPKEPSGPPGRGGPPPVDRAKLAAQIEDLSQGIAAYRERAAKIEKDFDDAYLALLTPEQRATVEKQRMDRMQRMQRDDTKLKGPAMGTILTDDEINRLVWENPMTNLASKVMVTMRMEMVLRRMPLDADQTKKLQDALLVFRESYLKLVDSVDLPTIRLSRIAQEAGRLGLKPAAKGEAPAVPKSVPAK